MTPRTKYVCEAGRRYWPHGAAKIAGLPVPTIVPDVLSGRVSLLELPEWAADIGIGQPPSILILPEFLMQGEGPAYERCDWFGLVDAFLNGAIERQAENQGRISHSYASKIDADPAIFDRAWVNRIFLFLRRWAAYRAGEDEVAFLGEIPQAEIWITHDVDAIRKTAAIRIKQVIMCMLGAIRYFARCEFRKASRRLGHAFRFFFATSEYWQFPEIRRLENEMGVRSAFFLYARLPGRNWNLKKWLIDPSYYVTDDPLRDELRLLRANGWEVGVHPSFWSWRDADRIAEERDIISQAAEDDVVICRQHWFRFSWGNTWRAQCAAGIEVDATLGINDRPGFRNASALVFRPQDPLSGQEYGIVAVPTVLMDSHLYDYKEITHEQRCREISQWIDEIVAVHGQAAVLWHQRVLSRDYGWKSGFEFLLAYIRPYVSKRSLASLSRQEIDIS